MAVRNEAFKLAVCKYMELKYDEAIRMLAEENEKAWKDRQAELDCAMDEGVQKCKAKGEYNEKIKNAINIGPYIDKIIATTHLSKEEI